jgi:hypothetical protein
MRTSLAIAALLAAGNAGAATGINVLFSNKPDPAWTRLGGAYVKSPRDLATGQASGKRAPAFVLLEAPGSTAQATVAGLREKGSVVEASYTLPAGVHPKRALWSWRFSWPASAETVKALSAMLSTPPKDIAVQFGDGRALTLVMCHATEWVPAVSTGPTLATQIALACSSVKNTGKTGPGWQMLEPPAANAVAPHSETVAIAVGPATSLTWPTCAAQKWEIMTDPAAAGRTMERLALTCGAPTVAAVKQPPSSALREPPKR